MKDVSIRKPTFAEKSKRKFRSRMLMVTNKVKNLGLIMDVVELVVRSRRTGHLYNV